MEVTISRTLTTRTASGTVIMTAAVRLVAQTQLVKRVLASFSLHLVYILSEK